jgi:short-subunit dehydrogenase involved in D-alanine esterification of teichoic acids
MINSITKQHPTLDCVILNAGIQRGLNFKKPETVDLDSVDVEFKTNYISPLHFTKAFLPFLQAQSSPTALIYVTSGLALVPLVRCGNYCASKAAVHHMCLTMREQLKDSNVKIIELLPPAVQTELHDEKHQPDIKNGRSIGMPLEEFTEAAWKGLESGDEQIPVGMSERAFEAFELKRQEVFHGMVKAMAAGQRP